MKTKGALVWDFHQPWSVDEIEIGDPRHGEVKVALERAGLCHSDHHLLTGDIPMAAFPILGGHEGAGVIVEIGPGVDDHRGVGDQPAPHRGGAAVAGLGDRRERPDLVVAPRRGRARVRCIRRVPAGGAAAALGA